MVGVRRQRDADDWVNVKRVTPALEVTVPGGQPGRPGKRGFFLQRWHNPRPETTIESIVVQTLPKGGSVPMVLAITTATTKPNLLGADPAAAPFSALYRGGALRLEAGTLPAGWSMNCWAPEAGGAVEATQVEGKSILRLSHLAGTPSLQIYRQNVTVSTGQRLIARVNHRGGKGNLAVAMPGITSRASIALTAAADWQTTELVIDPAEAAGPATFYLSIGGKPLDKMAALEIRDLQLVEDQP